jgi:hypothetical protein
VLNEYLDLPKNCDNLTAAPAVRLACLYWMRRLISSESTGPSSIALAGTTLYDAGPAILRELNAIFDREMGRISEGNPMSSSRPPSRRDISQILLGIPNNESKLRLWVLYVSAMAERATVLTARPQRFSIEFLSQARTMGYKSWRQLRDEALQQYLYDEELDPTGDAWYERVVGVPIRQLQFF